MNGLISPIINAEDEFNFTREVFSRLLNKAEPNGFLSRKQYFWSMSIFFHLDKESAKLVLNDLKKRELIESKNRGLYLKIGIDLHE